MHALSGESLTYREELRARRNGASTRPQIFVEFLFNSRVVGDPSTIGYPILLQPRGLSCWQDGLFLLATETVDLLSATHHANRSPFGVSCSSDNQTEARTREAGGDLLLSMDMNHPTARQIATSLSS
jgi:hypothetical protein